MTLLHDFSLFVFFTPAFLLAADFSKDAFKKLLLRVFTITLAYSEEERQS